MIRELRRFYFIVGIVTVILIGIASCLIETSSGWLGLFCGYFGILICICAVLYIMILQLNKENETRKQEQNNYTFFSLLSQYNRQQDKLLQKENYFPTILADIKSEITMKLEQEPYEFVCNNKVNLLNILSNMKKEIDVYISKKEADLPGNFKVELTKIKNKEVKFSHYIDTNSPLLSNLLFNELAYLLDRSIEIASDFEALNQDFETFVESSLMDYISNSFDDFYLVNNSYLEFSEQLANEIERFMQKLIKRGIYDLTELERIEYTQLVFERYYKTVIPYLRTFYQVLRFINKDGLWEKAKISYLEILKASLTEGEMLVLFYYAAYTFEGEEVFEELKEAAFFDDSQELEGNVKQPFFSKSDLLWQADDLMIMRENDHLTAEDNEIKVGKTMKEGLVNLFFRK